MKKYDAWYKTTFSLPAAGRHLTLDVPHDVFSTQRIDEGTLLLLDHLPKNVPSVVLDMGCGYGALGLPVAARFPSARVEMVDRDLLAVKCSAENAKANGLTGVDAYGSLGFRDLKSQDRSYDWILCNVPARIGTPFIENLLGSGRTRLKAGGDLRVVVIRDLGPVLEELASKNRWPLVEVARGPRHTIYSLAPEASPAAPEPDLYLRDQVEVGGLLLDRPFDFGGDDPMRLAKGIPILMDALPRQPRKANDRVLVFRGGYGQLPLIARKRWPESTIVVVDRDLLATTFIRRNAERLGLSGDLLDVRENAHFPDAVASEEKFDLVIGELSPSAGEKVAAAEITAIAAMLKPGAQALLLGFTKLEKEIGKLLPPKQKLTIFPLIKRDGYTVLRLA